RRKPDNHGHLIFCVSEKKVNTGEVSVLAVNHSADIRKRKQNNLKKEEYALDYSYSFYCFIFFYNHNLLSDF
ncbi:hypothetical protein, partial [Salmonella enterica]|uniref:hypothetical protein n=1 Tax=Salmonella enterica TaxID=28901 RepID=UPI0020C1B9AF